MQMLKHIGSRFRTPSCTYQLWRRRVCGVKDVLRRTHCGCMTCSTISSKINDKRLNISFSPPGQTGRWKHYVLTLSNRSSVCPSVRSSESVTKLMNTIFWKRVNRFWGHLVQVVHGITAWNDQHREPGGQRYRSRDRFAGLPEASSSTPFGWVTSITWYTLCFKKSSPFCFLQ